MEAVQINKLKCVVLKSLKYDLVLSLFQYALCVVQGPRLQTLCSDVTVSLSTSLPGFCSVVDFLQGAGQAHLVSQVGCCPYMGHGWEISKRGGGGGGQAHLVSQVGGSPYTGHGWEISKRGGGGGQAHLVSQVGGSRYMGHGWEISRRGGGAGPPRLSGRGQSLYGTWVGNK